MSALGMTSLLARPSMKPEDTVSACQNALLPIMKGIAAIGDLMTPENLQDALADGTLQDAGYLLAFLANLTLDLQHIEADAQYDLRTLNTESKGSHA